MYLYNQLNFFIQHLKSVNILFLCHPTICSPPPFPSHAYAVAVVTCRVKITLTMEASSTSQTSLNFYSVFTDKVERNCRFPVPGWNCMTHLQALQYFLFRYIKTIKSTDGKNSFCREKEWQLRLNLSVNAMCQTARRNVTEHRSECEDPRTVCILSRDLEVSTHV
jgi:hypothetical protein